MAQYPGLDGTMIFIADGAIRRFKPINYSNVAEGSKFDYAAGYLLTPLTVDEILETVSNPDRFVALTTRGGGSVHINSGSVVSVRPSSSINGPGAEIALGGLYQHVMEDSDEVLRLLGLAGV